MGPPSQAGLLPRQGSLYSRRSALKAMGGLGWGTVALVAGHSGRARADELGAQFDDPTQSLVTPSCVLSPEVMEGPFYVLDKVRRDIAEDRDGLPLELRFMVIDALTCQRIANAAVDIWHCDASGTYSGYATPDASSGTLPPGDTPPGAAPPHQEPINDLRFLRGVQFTNRHGVAAMRTIYPGWYPGRAVHVHIKVHVGGTVSAGRYIGGNVTHTGQLYMPEDLNVQVAAADPYVQNPIVRLANEADVLYRNFGGAGTEFTMMQPHHGARGSGPARRVAAIVVGVNPAAVPAST